MTRRLVVGLLVVLALFTLACGGGAPDNPTPVPTESTTPYPHPTR